ncbi:DEAD/DEAH box helicase [Phytopseudomonas seleniipraecipitans]|uniref:Non-specific serine/threonine protein kinase n=1 Tax=Phytopseudomonas seleniipraecipitans TaxID=640205 RepID=A0A1G7GEG4_9GAMM|nr:DEAD/DEAH box helicase [Pseudomonas seleniipraecipitans]SDE86516.1 non-specific serine/threonine protein kinase [Pseudomonas seleniipraecipitans]
MPDILHLQQADWRGDFDDGAMRRGQDYATRGLSRLLSLKDLSLLASCLGSGERPYQQRITLHPYGQGWGVTGHCSCPVGFNCKHVAAALLTLEARQRSGEDLGSLIVVEKPMEETRIDDVPPIPVLTLGSHVRVHFDARKGRMLEQTQHRAALAFDYQGHSAAGKPAKDLLYRLGPTHQLRIVRDAGREAELRHRLEDTGLRTALRQSEALAQHPGEHFELQGDAAWLAFMQQQVLALREEGWRIEVQPDFHYNLAQIDDWYADVDEVPEHGWFDLELGIEVEGQRISLLPILLVAIRRTPWLLSGEALAQRQDEEMLLVTLPHSQRRVALPYARLKPLLAALGELFIGDGDDIGTRVRLPRADATRLNVLQQGPALSWQGGADLRDFAERLQHTTVQTVTAPDDLAAQLRPYQLQGLGWMQALRELNVGGVLADDMGLGKTLQTLAHILLEKQHGRLQQPALIVMPTSLIPNWQDEAARFAPTLKVLALHGSKRRSLFKRIDEHDIVLTTYALLPRDLKALAAQRFHLLILDEAQSIKNPRSKAALAAGQIIANQRLCLSGTPLENHLGELWSLFNFLMPGWLGDSKGFTRDYRTPIEKHGNEQRLAHLRGRIKPFVLRRKKEQVARELPPKTEIIQWVELTPAQRDRYEILRLAMDRKVREEITRQGLARSQIVILEALLRLRQVCCDLRLLNDAPEDLASSDSGKLGSLLEMLEALIGEGRRVLLFSQFTSMLALIETELLARGIAYAKLTGSTRDRRTPVQQFQAGQFPVFLISLKAGGSGLNLTAADTVIHFDPWWNPAAEAQASDRAYRIGQDKPVFVYKLIARGSVEEKIQQLQHAKASLARGLLEEGGSQAQWQLSEDDLQALFAPLSD